MKSSLWFAVAVMTALYIVNVQADCDEPSSDSDEGEVKQWFKKVGCSIKKGAEDIQESAKPWTDKIANSAKDFGTSVAQKFDEVKHRLTDDKPSSESTRVVFNEEPTEKVPLAPLPSAATTGEHSTASTSTTTEGNHKVLPDAIDDRFLFQLNKCPPGQVLDYRQQCRDHD